MCKIIPFLSIFSLLQANTPWTPQAPITTSSEVQDFVSLAYDPSTQQVFSAWGSNPDLLPISSTYNGTTWGSPTVIDSSGTVNAFDVSLAYHAGYMKCLPHGISLCLIFGGGPNR